MIKKETIDKAIQTYFEKLLGVDKIDVNRLLSDNRIWINKEKQTAMAVVAGKKYVVPVSTLGVITKLFNKALFFSKTGIAYLPENSRFIGTADNRTEEEIKKAQSSRYYFEIDKENFNAKAIVDGQKFNMPMPHFYVLDELYHSAINSDTGMAYGKEVHGKLIFLNLDKPKD